MNNKMKIKIYSLLLASVISVTSFSSCKKQSPEVIEQNSISEKHNNFDSFREYRLTKARAELCYKGENIVVLINKGTNEISHYIYNSDPLKTEVYNLDTGEQILYIPFNLKGLSQGGEYYNSLIENSFVFNFVNIGTYIKNETCKDWYTMEDIEKIESKLLNFVLEMKESVKILRK